MKVEELLAMLQEKGMSDDDIQALLGEAMKALAGDDAEHDEKVDEAEAEKAEKERASELLGVNL